MLTREQIYDQYDVDESGMIRSPGKFEGEQIYAPYFYDIYLNGGHASDDGEVITVEVEEEDRAIFPELEDATHALIEVTETGFVYCSLE